MGYTTRITHKSHIKTTAAVVTAVTLLLFSFIAYSNKPQPLISNSNKPPKSIVFRRLLNSEHKNFGEIKAIIQDREGFIWIGADNLIRHEVHEYRIIHNQKIKLVETLYEDSKGIIWIGTAFGLYAYHSEKDQLEFYSDDPKSSIRLSDSYAVSIDEHPSGKIVIGTYDGGINILDTATGQIEAIKHNTNDSNSLSDNHIEDIEIDQHGNLWIATHYGLDKLIWKTREILHYRHEPGNPYSLSDNKIKHIEIDQLNQVWIATENGLNRLQPGSQQFTRFFHDPEDPNSLSGNFIWVVKEDSHGILWVGTDQQGLNAYRQETQNFQRYLSSQHVSNTLYTNTVKDILEDRNGDMWFAHFPTGISHYDRSTIHNEIFTHIENDPNSLSHNSVLSVLLSDENNLWLGTDGGGLNYFNRQNNTFKSWQSNPDNQNSLSGNSILSIYQDPSGLLWLGTWGAGVTTFDPIENTFTRLPFKTGNSQGISGSSVWTIYEDSFNDIWMGTHSSGLNRYNRKSKTFTHFKADQNTEGSLPNDLVWFVFEDSKKQLWIGTHGGLAKFNRQNNTFDVYRQKESSVNSLSNNGVLSFVEDSQNRLWFGTFSGLNLFDPETQTFTQYFDERSNILTVRSIVEDSRGILWLGTNDGVLSFDPATKQFSSMRDKNGWITGTIGRQGMVLAPNDHLIVAGVTGLGIVNLSPEDQNRIDRALVLTSLKIFGEEVGIEPENGILKKSINQTDQITFDHQVKMFSIQFAALNYRSPDKNQYAYRLKGFDNGWRNVGSENIARYTNLDAGTYQFEVKSTGENNQWVIREKPLTIKMLAPPWRTWWAYTLYFLGAITIVTLFIHARTSKFRHQQHMQQKINDELRKLDRVKSNFLAITSHELITPLNGIIGISEQETQNANDLPPGVQESLRAIHISGLRLHKVVKNILDFTKIVDGKPDLNLEKINITKEIQLVLKQYQTLAEEKHISLFLEETNDAAYTQVDRQKFNQIIGNLVFNAIKHTSHGKVWVSVHANGNKVTIKIHDTGDGIPEEKHSSLFSAFEQLEDANVRTREGLGLGLALTKKLVELHGGDISYESAPKKGTVFNITLDRCEFSDTPQTASGAQGEGDKAEKEEGKNPHFETPPHILVVDDDAINRLVITKLLEDQGYEVDEAEDGESALSQIEQKANYSLVVLDIMMPGLSGFEVCQRIREQYNKAELPIVFLSAKTDTQDISHAMDVGGNDYLQKPVIKNDVLPRIAHCLFQRPPY